VQFLRGPTFPGRLKVVVVEVDHLHVGATEDVPPRHRLKQQCLNRLDAMSKRTYVHLVQAK